jgi:PTH1 family peptidyl-tRNA hydrolase
VSRHLVVGLGNPGTEYRETRHNVGFMVLDHLADRYRIRLAQEKFDGEFASDRIAGTSVLLLKPQTYVNESGRSVGEAARFYDIDPDEIVVVHDDVDLDFGELRIKRGGGHGGHNGLRDIADNLGDKGFVRVRVGVGRPEYGSVRDHVLGQFERSEQRELEDLLDAACDALEVLLEEGANEAQNQYNGRQIT